MSVYVSFSDESGSGDGQGQFLVAGYVAKETDWPEFSKRWQEEILNSYPPIPYVHMVELRSLQWRENHGICKAQADEKTNAAVKLITQYSVIYPYLGSCPEAVYRRTREWFKEKGFDVQKKQNQADFPCFAAFALSVIYDIATVKSDVTEITFNISSKKYVEKLLRFDVRNALIDFFKETNPELAPLVGDVVPLSMDKHNPLQAADVLCWHLQRIYSKTVGTEEAPNVKLFEDRGFCGLTLNEEMIHQIAMRTILHVSPEDEDDE